MTLDEIKAAVKAGKIVHWANESYIVTGSEVQGYAIVWVYTGDCIGLTHKDGVTLNGKEEDFYISE